MENEVPAHLRCLPERVFALRLVKYSFWEDYVFHFCYIWEGSRRIFAARLMENGVPAPLRFVPDRVFAPRLV